MYDFTWVNVLIQFTFIQVNVLIYLSSEISFDTFSCSYQVLRTLKEDFHKNSRCRIHAPNTYDNSQMTELYYNNMVNGSSLRIRAGEQVG